MQLIAHGPDIPDALLQAHEDGRVVFFCGAGISCPAGLPGFKGLVDGIYRPNGTAPSDIERAALHRGQYDATLDLLERRLPGQRLAVRRAPTCALKPELRRKGAADTHAALLRLAHDRDGASRLGAGAEGRCPVRRTDTDTDTMRAMSSLLDDLNRNFVQRTPHMRDIGARITAVDKGRGSMTLPARAEWLGDPLRGMLHPGALTVLADSACGLAVGTMLTELAPYATLDLRMDYLRPAGPERDVHCGAHCFRLTRNVAFVRAEVHQADREQPIAVAQASFMLSTPGAARPPREAGAEAEADAWQPPAGSEPVLAGVDIPYVDYLGIRLASGAEPLLFRMPYQDKLIGNPLLPALHGGVIAGFAETAATLHLIRTLRGAKFPKSIDFSIDYLRSGRPQECFAACEVVRVGSRVALVQVRVWQKEKGPEQPIAVARGHFLLTAAEAASPPAA